MRYRPAGVVIDGRLELGLEVEVDDAGTIQRIGPQTGLPEPWILSPAFVDAHSHLEYRGLRWMADDPPTPPDAEAAGLAGDALDGYLDWIRALTRLKAAQSDAQVRTDVAQAAAEKRAAGIGLIAEHADRPYAGAALRAVGIRGRIFQEYIDLAEADGGAERMRRTLRRAEGQRRDFGGPVDVSPHASWTVSEAALRTFGADPAPVSIHVAETALEDALFRDGSGPLADAVRRFRPDFAPPGVDVAAHLRNLGLMRPGAQWVHGCALDPDLAPELAAAGVALAHCPRSNRRLRCPAAPVREWLDAGMRVGLGLDSPASGGDIDVFAEMRAALDVARERGRPLEPEEVWRMATDLGAASIGFEGWRIAEGCAPALIAIRAEGAYAIGDVLAAAGHSDVEWIHV